MRFPPEFIDRLRSQIVLSEVVGRRVALKRRGREYQGLCPFHHEKSPSFTVNDEKGFYHCFGCGAHGDAIRFLTDHEGMQYKDAIERLAGEAGLPIPQMTREQVETARRFGNLQEVMEAACQWYEQQLMSAEGKAARDYLKGRGLTGRTAQAFRLGFAPEGRDVLKMHLMKQGVSERQLVEVGLAIKPDQGMIYDRFRARVMFPITDRRGKVIAFGGRILPSLSGLVGRDAPKYLNSPETPLFKKGEVLYNYEKARQPAHKTGTVLVAEGYMDVIALHHAGIGNAVAPLGTAVTENHLRLLWQLADEPVLCLDGDAAGQRAMQRAAELSLPLLKPGKSLRFLILPKGEDPDTLVRKQGADAFTALLAISLPLSDALWEQQAGDIAGASPEKKATIEHNLMRLTERIQDKTVRNHFRAHYRKLLWPERKGGKAVEKVSTRREIKQLMQQGSHAMRRQRECAFTQLIVLYPSLLQQGEVEEALGCFVFSDKECERICHFILDAFAKNHALRYDTLVEYASGQGCEEMLAAFLKDASRLLPPLASEREDEHYALLLWRLHMTEDMLIRLREERQELEMELVEEMDENAYARLVTLESQIGELQNAFARLQNDAHSRT